MFPPVKPALADSLDHPSLPMGCALPFKALSLFAIIHSVAWAGALEWPQFRGPTGEGASDATNVPVRWDEKQNVECGDCGFGMVLPGGVRQARLHDKRR